MAGARRAEVVGRREAVVPEAVGAQGPGALPAARYGERRRDRTTAVDARPGRGERMGPELRRFGKLRPKRGGVLAERFGAASHPAGPGRKVQHVLARRRRDIYVSFGLATAPAVDSPAERSTRPPVLATV